MKLKRKLPVGQLSVPYLGSNCLEQVETVAQATGTAKLSVPYLGSNCLEPDLAEDAAYNILAFSTLPRVELPGAHSASARRYSTT